MSDAKAALRIGELRAPISPGSICFYISVNFRRSLHFGIEFPCSVGVNTGPDFMFISQNKSICARYIVAHHYVRRIFARSRHALSSVVGIQAGSRIRQGLLVWSPRLRRRYSDHSLLRAIESDFLPARETRSFFDSSNETCSDLEESDLSLLLSSDLLTQAAASLSRCRAVLNVHSAKG